MDYRRANFSLFRDLLGGIPWDTVLKRGGVQETWFIFKHYLLQAQLWFILMSRKSSKSGRHCMDKYGAPD